MFATTRTVTIVLLIWMTCSYCCHYCSAATQDRRHGRDHTREHARTRNSTRQQRTKHLTAGMPLVTTAGGTTSAVAAEAADPEDKGGGGNTTNVGLLRNYLIRRPTGVIRSLMQTGVSVVQTGMDAFEGVSNAVYRTITPVRRSSRSVKKTRGTRRRRRHSTAARTDRPSPGLVRSVGRSVVDMFGTGISGVKQVTDLGLLLGNIGTQKLRSELNGESGNQEIFQMLIKYVASRVGTRTTGNAEQFIDDVGTVSAFMAADDQTTRAMSIVMERLMNDPDVCASMVRIAISMLQSSPSTSCLLDKLPLSASDIRMLFNVFVGSNGQLMLKTIAGMVSELTTGPETKEFLQAVLGMTSLFSSSTDGKAAGSESPDKPKTSVYGSLKNFFTGEGAGDDKTAKPQTKPKKKRKSGGKKARGPPKAKLPKKTHMEISKDDEDWFSDMGADDFGGNMAAGSASARNSDAGGVGGPVGSRTNISNSGKPSGGNHGKKKTVKDDGGNDLAP